MLIAKGFGDEYFIRLLQLELMMNILFAMNPFKSSVYILYRFTPMNNGLKITPIHYYRYYFSLVLWVFAGGVCAMAVSTIIGSNKLGAYCFLPVLLIVLIGGARMNMDLKWTYGSQIVNAVTYADGILSIELLEHQEGGTHLMRTFLDIPKRNVVHVEHLPVTSMLEIITSEEIVEGDKYFSQIGVFAAMDENDEPSTLSIPISPRFSTMNSLEIYSETVHAYLTEGQYLESE